MSRHRRPGYRWDEQVRNTETLAAVACRLAEFDWVPPAEPPDPEADAASARVTELVADLVEPAKATALEKLDEGRQALTIATAWLRAKLAPSRSDSQEALGAVGS